MNLNTNFVKHSVGIFARYIKKRFDDGPNPNHYDEEGNDYRGFNLDGIHKVTGTTRDESGFDEWGIDLEGSTWRDMTIGDLTEKASTA